MRYNPNIHHRRSIRLKGYDYSQAGAYFITICCENRECRFGKIVVGAGFTPALNDDDNTKGQPQIGQPQIGQPQEIAPTMELNEYGQIAYNEWIKLSERFLNFELDVFQIMPNHIHAIIVLNEPVVIGQPQGIAPTDAELNVGAGFTSAHHNVAIKTNATVGDMVGAYKSLVANGCLDIYKTKNKTIGKLWQRNYHEHIIRNEQSYQTISEYIINNPARWKDDKFFN